MQTLGLILALVASLSSTNAADPEIITVDQRFSGIACRGLCTDSHIVVRSDGLVEVSSTPLGGKTVRNRFVITAEEFADFRRAYSAIRPDGLKGPIGNCDNQTAVIDWKIYWEGPDRNSQLLACRDVEAVRKAYVEGYRILRVWPGTTMRVSKEVAADIR
jgi:hypothetical protein